LEADGELRAVSEWGLSLMDELCHCAQLLDSAHGGEHYYHSVTAQKMKLQNSDETSSARILHDMREREQSFFQWASVLSEQHARYFTSHPLSPEQQQYFVTAAQQSLQAQRDLEAQPQTQTFADYLASYYAQYDGI
jgi:glutamate--cysteine ligase